MGEVPGKQYIQISWKELRLKTASPQIIAHIIFMQLLKWNQANYSHQNLQFRDENTSRAVSRTEMK